MLKSNSALRCGVTFSYGYHTRTMRNMLIIITLARRKLTGIHNRAQSFAAISASYCKRKSHLINKTTFQETPLSSPADILLS